MLTPATQLAIARQVLAENPHLASAWSRYTARPKGLLDLTAKGREQRRAKIDELSKAGLLADAIAPLIGISERQVIRIRRSLREAA